MVRNHKRYSKPKRSISKLFILSFISIFFLLTIILLGFLTKNYFNAKSIINTKIKHQSDRISDKFVDAIEYNEHIMNYIARQIVIHAKYKDYRFIESILSNNIIDEGSLVLFSNFVWTNEKHQALVSSKLGFHLNEKIDLSNRDYIPKTITNPFTIQLGKPVIGIISKKYSIPAGYGIKDKSGKYLGAIVTGFVIEGLQRKFDEIIGPETINFILADKNGLIIAHSPNSNLEIVKDFFANQKQEEPEGMFYDSKLFRSNKNYGSTYYKKVGEYPYFIFTEYNKEIESNLLTNIVVGYAAISSSLLLIVSLLLLYFYKSFVKPVSKLAIYAKNLALSDEFQGSIPRCNSAEISDLSKAILMVRKSLFKEKLLKSELKKANNLKTVFLKTINHDIKNYSHSILGFSQLLLDSKSTIKSEEDQKILKTISDQALELSQFIHDLLDVEQSETGKLAISKISRCQIKDLINNIVYLNKAKADQNKITIKTDLENIVFITDKIRLKQILVNLITNAIKYSPQNTEINISARITAEQKLFIEIKDQGFGMDEKELSLLFSGKGAEINKKQFFGNQKIDSHGIGMNTVLQLIELLQGKIEIESKKWHGTIVRLYFSAFNQDEKEYIDETSKEKEREEVILKTDYKILLVDDDPVVSMMTKMSLKHLGFENVKSAEDGMEALKILEQENFDYILMDSNMPIVGGIEAIKKIKESEKHYNCRIIAITGNDDEQSIKEAKDAGADEVLNKPFTPEKLKNIFKNPTY